MSQDPNYDAEVEAARAAEQRPDSAAADAEAGGADVDDSGPGTSGLTGEVDEDPAGVVDETPGMDSVEQANAEGTNPDA